MQDDLGRDEIECLNWRLPELEFETRYQVLSKGLVVLSKKYTYVCPLLFSILRVS